MSYIKNTWANGDVITAAKLNNIEDGIDSIQADPYPGYDLVFKYLGSPLSSIDLTKLTIVKGNIEDCSQVLADGAPVKAMLVCLYPYSEGDDINECLSYNSSFFNLAYDAIVLACSAQTNGEKRSCTIIYDSYYEVSDMTFEPWA